MREFVWVCGWPLRVTQTPASFVNLTLCVRGLGGTLTSPNLEIPEKRMRPITNNKTKPAPPPAMTADTIPITVEFR